MNVVGHNHPGSELIKVSSVLAVQESIGHHTGYSGIPQPNGRLAGDEPRCEQPHARGRKTIRYRASISETLPLINVTFHF
jgi:hypothetical protein